MNEPTKEAIEKRAKSFKALAIMMGERNLPSWNFFLEIAEAYEFQVEVRKSYQSLATSATKDIRAYMNKIDEMTAIVNKLRQQAEP